MILAYTAGKMRKFRIRTGVGDRVTVEMSPYDLARGRITFRHKSAQPTTAATGQRRAMWRKRVTGIANAPDYRLAAKIGCTLAPFGHLVRQVDRDPFAVLLSPSATAHGVAVGRLRPGSACSAACRSRPSRRSCSSPRTSSPLTGICG